MAMKKYKANAVVGLLSGKVKLTKDQASSREFSVECISKKGNTYKIIEGIQFKAGEEFSYDGDIPKSVALDVSKLGKKETDTETETETDTETDTETETETETDVNN